MRFTAGMIVGLGIGTVITAIIFLMVIYSIWLAPLQSEIIIPGRWIF